MKFVDFLNANLSENQRGIVQNLDIFDYPVIDFEFNKRSDIVYILTVDFKGARDFDEQPEYHILGFDLIANTMSEIFSNNSIENTREKLYSLSDLPTKTILCSKGGGGKDYLKSKFKSKGMKVDISYTSRKKRDYEVEGKDYIFISKEEFERKIANNEMLQFDVFNGEYYGTSLKSWYDNDVFILTPNGVAKLSKKLRIKAFIIYLDIALSIRRTRLMERHKDEKIVERRLQEDEIAFYQFKDYEVRITNPDF